MHSPVQLTLHCGLEVHVLLTSSLHRAYWTCLPVPWWVNLTSIHSHLWGVPCLTSYPQLVSTHMSSFPHSNGIWGQIRVSLGWRVAIRVIKEMNAPEPNTYSGRENHDRIDSLPCFSHSETCPIIRHIHLTRQFPCEAPLHPRQS